MSVIRTLAAVALASLAGGACAPKLVVRNGDPTIAFAQIRVDGESRGFVQTGKEVTLRLPAGYHHVEAVPRGETTNPWAEDGAGWTVYVDRKAELTLLPRP